MRRILTASLAVIASLGIMANFALADGPNYGTKNPTNNPYFPCANPSMLVKCLPAQIPFTHDEGIHIVRLPMGGSGGTGEITFWCLNQVGFKYFISVADLDANSVYTVTAEDQNGTTYTLGEIHTNANGDGTLNGILRLDAGGYHMSITVTDSEGTTVISGGGGFLVV